MNNQQPECKTVVERWEREKREEENWVEIEIRFHVSKSISSK